MSGDTHRRGDHEEATPPVAEDDFAEFAEPPRHRPPAEALQERPSAPPPDNAQSEVDDVIARLRRKRAEEG